MRLNENRFNLWGKITSCPCFNQSNFPVYHSVLRYCDDVFDNSRLLKIYLYFKNRKLFLGEQKMRAEF